MPNNLQELSYNTTYCIHGLESHISAYTIYPIIYPATADKATRTALTHQSQLEKLQLLHQKERNNTTTNIEQLDDKVRSLTVEKEIVQRKAQEAQNANVAFRSTIDDLRNQV